jgi:hypothetical protein
MLDPEIRKAIYRLYQQGMPVRRISRDLRIARDTVRQVIRLKGALPASARRDKIELDAGLLRRLYEECGGYRERVYERLLEENDELRLSYPTLTRRLRELGIGTPVTTRCDQVPDKPGAEMQHDTTRYDLLLGDILNRLVASLIYLRYSKRRYLKFYLSFNRFKMKCFFHEGLTFWKYTAPECIIDNTNLARLRGTGENAVIVPEMEMFAKTYGFRFVCHRRGHANRKAGNERSFFTVETNFLPGRRFTSLEDLNAQAFEWATVKMENRPVAKSTLIPAQAFQYEKAFLTQLPPYLPAPYLTLQRGIDQYGYVAVDANFYWVPGQGRGEVQVLKYSDHLEIYQARQLLIRYDLAPEKVKHERFSPPGYPKPRYQPQNRKRTSAEEEKRLRGMGDVVASYLDFALRVRGLQRHRFLRELFRLAQHMSPDLFAKTVERARKYRITALDTIKRIATLQLTSGFEELPSVDVDEHFRDRETYLEGALSDAPDLTAYDELMEQDDE